MEMKESESVVRQFQGEYRFLSNFWAAPVMYGGIVYQNNEAAFQAQKCLDDEEKRRFSNMEPAQAKREGRRVKLRPDWETVKVGLMYEIVKAKFTQNPELGQLLLHTGDAALYEGNHWHDCFWGVSLKTGRGKNHLGQILMKVREELRQADSSTES